MPHPLIDSELEVERHRLRRIQDVHQGHLDRARRVAEQLAAEAVEATEDGGLRDVYDEDAESDAAIAAGLVRQTSARAMHAYRRVAELEGMGRALAFGYTTNDDGTQVAVGRLSVIDDDDADGDALLVDWRAKLAIPFYRATPLDRLDVRQRRQFHYGDGVATDANQLDAYSDEVFDLERLEAGTHLRGEAALLASVSAPTNDQMRSVVATIQAEQDAVIRASAVGPLVVQGGPGTGKTVVALHRAAYLLYEQRANLSDTGVLIVGPTTEFLRYIRDVLPSLGETGVVSVTAAKLFPGVLLGLHDPPRVAEIKGRAVMAVVLAKAIDDRQRPPLEPLTVWYGSRRVVLTSAELQHQFRRAKGHRTHNEGAAAFREFVIDALAAQVYDPAFPNTDDAVSTFSESRDVRQFLLRHWPPLTPEQALNDLFGSTALLRRAALGAVLSRDEADSLHRKRTSEADLDGVRWSEADVPLLDELLFLLGGPDVNQFEDRDLERDEADEFEAASHGATVTAAGGEDEFDFDEDEEHEDDAEIGWIEEVDEETLTAVFGTVPDPDSPDER